jgi:hypothetical protein
MSQRWFGTGGKLGFEFAVSGALARTNSSDGRIIVIIELVVITIGDIITLARGNAWKVSESTRIYLAVKLIWWDIRVARAGNWSYPGMTLDDAVDVGRGILIELHLVAMTLFWIWDKNRTDATGTGRSSPKMITATSTEHRTPSSYAFLNRPFFRWMLKTAQTTGRSEEYLDEIMPSVLFLNIETYL